MNEIKELRIHENGHNEIDPRTYIVFWRDNFPFGKKSYVETVEGIGSARVACVEWNQENGDGLSRGKAAEFTLVENWAHWVRQGQINERGRGSRK